VSYVDTSALLKWYIPERGSEQFGAWMSGQKQIEISRLTCVEVRCALARRQRAGSLSKEQAAHALEQFMADVHDGLFTLHSLHDQTFLDAEDLVAASPTPLRTLDALHLAVASGRACSAFVTADAALALAAGDAGLTTIPI